MVLSFAALSQNVVQGEYFIDADAGFGNNTLVTFTPSADNSFPFTADLTGLQPGYHKLYIRTKDSDGNWSLTTRRNIEILTSGTKSTIISGEYFIDADPGFGLGTPINISTPDSIILQNFTAIATGLPEGYHKLYGRLIDNEGNWGITFRRNIEVYKSATTSVAKAEYFFRTDLGFGDCTPVTFITPAADGSFSFNIPRNTIPAGADTLFIRVQDDLENRWSVTQWTNGVSGALPLTLLNFTVIKNKDNAMLNWQTTREVNTAYFYIQRSNDAINFTTVGKVQAKAGNSLQNNYSFTDNIALQKAGNVYYRLQMTDNDGTFAYSRIAYITISAAGTPISIYPNPAHNYFVIDKYENIDAARATIIIRDITGHTVVNQKFNHANRQKINITALSKGLYIVSVVTPEHIFTQKLLIE